jgi:hypothetical protein
VVGLFEAEGLMGEGTHHPAACPCGSASQASW